MKSNLKFLCFSALMILSFLSYSQVDQIKLNPEKVKKFIPYMEFKHGGVDYFPAWKENNKLQYAKEMWYYTESFYIKRNYLNEGIVLNEEIIDVTRFESQRKENEETIVTLPGFKDVLVLIPAKNLIYKP
ncbi:MAG: hypothetical protein H0W61_02785 [Bacteroidetes bacterium]|nr:hypothetical protein [Bacteroidota bacterium]